MTCNHEACGSYSVPEHVREHVDIILPTVNFDAKLLPRSTPKLGGTKKGAPIRPFVKTDGSLAKGGIPGSLATCDQEITPDCLRALYNFQHTPVATDKNSYGIGIEITFLYWTWS